MSKEDCTIRDLVGGPNEDGICSEKCKFLDEDYPWFCKLVNRVVNAGDSYCPKRDICPAIFSFAVLGSSDLMASQAHVVAEHERTVSGRVSNHATDTWGGAGPDCCMGTTRGRPAAEIRQLSGTNRESV